MKLTCALGAFLLLSCATPALAQSYPGEEITVNPTALGRGYLLYPGGKFGRSVGNLLQPGERRGDLGAIHLHMPVKHPRVARAPRPAPVIPLADTLAAPDTMAAATPPPPPPPKPRKPKPAPTRTAAATPPPPTTNAPTGGAADLSSLPEDSAARLAGFPSSPAPAKPAKPPKPTRTASATPPPANTTPPPAMEAGLSIQATVPFGAGASSPSNSDVNAVHALATSLKGSLNSGASRVQLQAFGGAKGDKGSEARRLSLKRALVIRELLIEDGVPSEKIDVRAMGGVDDNGAPDRVDVYLRG